MTEKYVLDDEGNAVPEPDILKWGRWFEKAQRHVALTEIRGSRVSTVFLALDHSFGEGPPLLWETMVFGGKFDGEQDRYPSLEEAKRGHDAMVGKITRDSLPTVPFRDLS